MGVYGEICRQNAQNLSRKTVFQAEVYATLACINETESQDRTEKFVSICSDSQAALKGLQAAKTTSPLV